MTQDKINEMRSRIAELEERDADFARKSNLLLDEILITRDQIAENAKAIAESRRDIDQLADRTGELAQSISELRESQQDLKQSQQLLTFTISQVAESMTILRQTQQAFVEQAVADRQAFQAEIQRIWEYLMTTRPNGRGDLGWAVTETPGVYKIPPKPSWESQLLSLPPDVKSVAESLALRDMESAKRYVSQYLSANRGEGVKQSLSNPLAEFGETCDSASAAALQDRIPPQLSGLRNFRG